MSAQIMNLVNPVQQFGNSALDNVPHIKGDGFELVLNSKFLYSVNQIPGYKFDIIVGGEPAGSFTMLLEKDFSKIRTEGNVGIELKQKFFGRQLPQKVANVSLPLFKGRGLNTILITHDSDNTAIEKACEQLRAQYLDSLTSEDDNSTTKRYTLETRGPDPV